jgi:hypothetical protein
MKGFLDFFRETCWKDEDRDPGEAIFGGASEPPRSQHAHRSTPMVSLAQRGGRHALTALALALAIWIFSGSSAMAQHGGHGGGGGFGGTGHIGGRGHMGGLGHRGFAGVGGYGFYPGFYGPGFAVGGLGYGGYGYGYPYFGGYGTGYGYPYFGNGIGYGYGSTYYDTGFVAPALGFGY